MKFLKSASVLILPLLLLGAGCGEASRFPEGVPVTGTLWCNGEPLEGATVIFSPVSGGRSASALTEEGGKFALGTIDASDGATPGQYNVAVIKSEVDDKTVIEDPQQYLERTGKLPPSPKNVFVVPRKFANPAKSGISAEVPADGVTDMKIEFTTK